ncbi:uncharacterized protein H6S33_002994 [Morchella sextelata]|uniref:uncharacterized protein n=1 Tax=Morchella sextelata TaxID=1174677 RepID=UPI001D04325F|nr:uncharacterized protein H6S33_002994 [Morchella sextelata]KAH0607006.1 hypothetical protein H6S33_002994 [Morchella sextelata]
MFGSPTESRRGDGFEGKARGVLRAVERARLQFLQKTKPPSVSGSGPTSPGGTSTSTLTHTYFDLLPTELLIAIISRTTWRDVTTLRRVSRAFRDLVDTHEHIIVTQWLLPGSYLTLLSQLFYPPRSRTGDGTRRATVQYFYGLERRHVTCSQLAYYLCDKALTPMFCGGRGGGAGEFSLDRRARREAEGKKELAIRAVQRRLTKQLYYVLHFLTYSRLRLEASQAVTAAENSDDYHTPPSPLDLTNTYTTIQSSIIGTFDNSTLISTHHAMHFLVNLLRLSLSPEPPHNQNDEQVALILRCTMPLQRCVEFFAADVPSASGRLRKQFMSDMQDERVEMEAKLVGRAAGGRRGSTYGGSRRVWAPRVGEVWFDAAKKALGERGLREHGPDGVYFFPDCSQELLVGCPDCQLRPTPR